MLHSPFMEKRKTQGEATGRAESLDSLWAQRIDLLRFLLIVGLVFLHYGNFPGSELSPFRGYVESPNPVATFINSAFLFLFFSAVPLLSCISGWLFFKHFRFDRQFFLSRLTSRSRSILLPMVLWNGLVLMIFFVGFVVAPNATMLSVVSYPLDDLGPDSVLNALLGITRHPINFQFWFLRDLLVTMALSPLLALCMCRLPFTGLTVLVLGWLTGFDFLIFFRADVLLFFYVGGLIRLGHWVIEDLSFKWVCGWCSAYLVLVVLRTLAPGVLDESVALESGLLDLLTRLMRLAGIVAFWGMSPYLLQTRAGQYLLRLGPLAFFVHAIHWPLNQAIKAMFAALLGEQGSGPLLINYFATTLLTVVIAVLVARVLNALASRWFDVLSGGRGGLFAQSLHRP